MRPLFLTYRFFVGMGIVIFVMAVSFFAAWLFYIALMLLVGLIAFGTFEYWKLSQIAPGIKARRKVVEQLSLGDEQTIYYTLVNTANETVDVDVLDELPYQFQERSILQSLRMEPASKSAFELKIRPLSRGEYHFGELKLMLSYPLLGVVHYQVSRAAPEMVMVYPSVLQMKKYALQISSRTATMYGIRRVRTIGENDEFEHIRQYQQGDNIKSINWKATSRRGELLVNQYQDSRSQMVYCVIDKGRSMEMPFDGLSLLDYSINTALVLSNITLNRYDKAGLITFSKDIDTYLPADSHTQQLERILSLLYNQKTNFEEPNFEKLYYHFRHFVSRRSIVFLFTNFESLHDFYSKVKYLKALAHRHLLIVICFENAELSDLQHREVNSVSDIYDQTIATSFIYEKKKILIELQHHGIQVVYTKPRDLSIQVINKYLELKAKRMK